MSASEASRTIASQTPALASEKIRPPKNKSPCDSCSQLKRRCVVTSPGAECFHCKKMGRICIISKRDHEQLVGIYNAKWYEPEKVKVKRSSRSKKLQRAPNGDQGGGSISPMQMDLPTNTFEDLSVSIEPVLRLYYNLQE
ncbi:hypothetical protein SCHPADRAFT_891822 [Schizopora paradoxa]|uniref:Zn(2)-C6 fungal-type domain-containing protein n=1 Tax=Schizopora paradoxa TaxID=27342 RepID=A0A0H2RH60_9AGAM|nr:hypothetical protein SCHPADRAFT_891822 [Schizopora paradoxa]